MSKIKNIFILRDIIEFLPLRKRFEATMFNKALSEELGYGFQEKRLLKKIFNTPLAPLHFNSCLSKKSDHINGFFYNRVEDYRNLIRDQIEEIDPKDFDKSFKAYLQSLQNDNYIIFLDPSNEESLLNASQLSNLNYGIFMDLSLNQRRVNLTNINLVYFSANFEKIPEDIRNNLLDQLAKCENLRKMKVGFPIDDIGLRKIKNLPALRKIEITNNWRTSTNLLNALNAIQHMGDTLESLTLYTFYKCVTEDKIRELSNALSNFKKVKSLYIRHGPTEIVKYATFINIFSVMKNNLEKLKFEMDFFDPNDITLQITFETFYKLKRFIIKKSKQPQSIYNLKSKVDCDIKYSKRNLHHLNLEGLNESTQGYNIIFDKEGYTLDEENHILSFLKFQNIKLLSLKALNCQISKNFLQKVELPNLEQLEFDNIIGEWKLEDFINKNKGLKKLTLNLVGNQNPSYYSGIPQSIIMFPEIESNIKELTINKSTITNTKTFFKCLKNLKSLKLFDLKMNLEDFKYFCKNINQLENLESLYYGSIDTDTADDNLKNELINNFFSGISKIPKMQEIVFKNDFRMDLEFLRMFAKNLSYMRKLKRVELFFLEEKDSFEARKLLLQACEGILTLKTLKLNMIEA